MKTTIILLGIVIMGFLSEVKAQTLEFVVTKTDTLMCKKITVGEQSTSCKLNSGKKVHVQNNQILQYMHNGKFMVRMPIYSNNQATSKTDFMQWVDYRKGVKVYKHEVTSGNCTNEIISLYCNNKLVHELLNPSLNDTYEYIYQFSSTAISMLTNE